MLPVGHCGAQWEHMGNKSEKSIPNDAPADVGVGVSAFHGNFDHVLDEKGRLSVPAEYRQVIQRSAGSKVVVTNSICDGVRCLEGFLLVEWSRFEERLRSRSRFDPQLQKLENFYLSRAAVCGLDGSGRILVPQYLRTYATLEKEVVFTSSLYGFRIWDRRVWELVFREAEAALLENPELFRDVDR